MANRYTLDQFLFENQHLDILQEYKKTVELINMIETLSYGGIKFEKPVFVKDLGEIYGLKSITHIFDTELVFYYKRK